MDRFHLKLLPLALFSNRALLRETLEKLEKYITGGVRKKS